MLPGEAKTALEVGFVVITASARPIAMQHRRQAVHTLRRLLSGVLANSDREHCPHESLDVSYFRGCALGAVDDGFGVRSKIFCQIPLARHTEPNKFGSIADSEQVFRGPLGPRETSTHDRAVVERDFSCHCRRGNGGAVVVVVAW